MATKTKEDYEREAIERHWATAQPGSYYSNGGKMEQYTGWNGGSVTGADMMAAINDSIRYGYDIMLDPRNNGGARDAIGNLLLDANEKATKMAAAGQGTYEENRQTLLDQIGWTDYQTVFQNLQNTGSLGLKDLEGNSIESSYGLGNPNYGAEPKEPTPQELAMAQAMASQQMGGMGGFGSYGGQGGAWGYDQENDPVWNAYLKQYTRAADKGMNDVLAQLSARTGGLASSYAGQVAQQTHNDIMQGATDMIPQLYDAAYGRYMDEQNMQIAADERAYQRQQDALDRQLAAEQQAYERQMYADELAANERNQNLDLLLSMMGIGYQPTAQELSSVGLNQGMADAIYGDYLRGVTPKSSGASSGGGGTYKPTLTAAQVLKALEDGVVNDTTTQAYEYYYGQPWSAGIGVSESDVSDYESAIAMLKEIGASRRDQMSLVTESEWRRKRESGSSSPEAAYDSYAEYLRAYIEFILNG